MVYINKIQKNWCLLIRFVESCEKLMGLCRWFHINNYLTLVKFIKPDDSKNTHKCVQILKYTKIWEVQFLYTTWQISDKHFFF